METLLHSEVAHFVIYLALIAFIGGMPAPTVNSSTGYKWAFASLNMFAMNFSRAIGPKIEKSPNFQAAMNIQQAQAGQPQTVVQPIPPAPGGD